MLGGTLASTIFAVITRGSAYHSPGIWWFLLVIIYFSKVTGLNFVFKPGVEGSVTYTAKQIPWDKALYIFLEQNGLELVLEENTLTIQKKEKTEKESKDKKEDKK